MRVNHLVAVTSLFIVFLLIVSVVVAAQVAGQNSSETQEVIQKAFPNSKTTWSEEIEGEMVNFKATSTALAIMIGNGDKRKIKFINFKDTIDWAIDCDKRSCRQYDLVGGKEPKLLIRGFEHGMSKTKVIDTKGEEIFDLTLTSWLLSSPTGRYYHTVDNQDSYNILKVYDSEGSFLWEREEYQGGDWFSMHFPIVN